MSTTPPEDDPPYQSRYLGPDHARHKATAMERRLSRQERIMEWLDGCNDPVAHASMKTWALAVLSGGAQVATGSFRDSADRGYPNLYYAVVPDTGAMVVFYETFAAPVRLIRFVAVIDWP